MKINLIKKHPTFIIMLAIFSLWRLMTMPTMTGNNVRNSVRKIPPNGMNDVISWYVIHDDPYINKHIGIMTRDSKVEVVDIKMLSW